MTINEKAFEYLQYKSGKSSYTWIFEWAITRFFVEFSSKILILEICLRHLIMAEIYAINSMKEHLDFLKINRAGTYYLYIWNAHYNGYFEFLLNFFKTLNFDIFFCIFHDFDKRTHSSFRNELKLSSYTQNWRSIIYNMNSNNFCYIFLKNSELWIFFLIIFRIGITLQSQYFIQKMFALLQKYNYFKQ